MKKKILLSVFLLFFLLGTANSATLFYDEIFDGTYTFDNSIREMIMSFKTIYSPYDSESGDYYPDGERGAGTEISWKFTLDFSDWVGPDGELPGEWEESWIRGYRMGDFDYFRYGRTGENELGQNTGEYFGSIVEVSTGPDLGPEGPWFVFGQLTRTETSNESGYYTSSGTIDGYVTNEKVPEPATLLLLCTGLFGIVGVGTKKFFKK